MTASIGDGTAEEVRAYTKTLSDRIAALEAGGGSSPGSLSFFDDFVGAAPVDFPTSANIGTPWRAALVGDGPPFAKRTGSYDFGGWAQVGLEATDEAQTAGISLDRYLGLNSIGATPTVLIFQSRMAIHSLGAGVSAHFGMVGADEGDDPYAWFSINEAGLVTCNAIHGVPTSSAITMANDTAYTFKIDVTDFTDIKFYIDDVRVAAGTTFSANQDTGVNIGMGIAKDSGTGTGSLLADYLSLAQGTRSPASPD